MNKIVSTKRTSAIFLAIVLVTGTFALSSQSFNIGVNAQAQPYYDGMDSYYDMKSYGMDDSYGPTDYGMDNDRKSYDNSYYKSQYSSYKPDYKPKHSSYDDKDDRDKSKDSKKSVSINKLNCINTNLNINGVNSGNINVGNKGQGYVGVGAYSSDGSGGYGGDEGYYDGHNKKDKGFDCIINNNNNNTNVVIEQPPVNVTDECEECFAQVLNVTELGRLQAALVNGINVTIGTTQVEINSLEALCDVLENLTGAQLGNVVGQILTAANIPLTRGEFFELVTCLGTALGITLSPTIGPIMR